MNSRPKPNDRNRAASDPGGWTVTRRDFLKASGVFLAGVSWGTPIVRAAGRSRTTPLRFGIVTDAHFAATDARGNRYYRQSTTKMAECVALMNEQQVDFLVELGDFKDEGKPAVERETLRYLETIESVFSRFEGRRYHVLGNHDVDSISKAQFMARITNSGIAPGASFYAFDAHGIHFVVLDANYRADGADYDHGNFEWTDANIPPHELEWLQNDLASSSKPVVVFVHQLLDGHDKFCVRNAAQVRQILQASRRVRAVFQGHKHSGQYRQIQGIHYYTLKAMVDGSGTANNSYAIVEVNDDLSIEVKGYRRAESKMWKASS